MTPQEILKIPLTSPESLFKTPDELEKTYRALAKEWHPDTNKLKDASQVFSHLNVLHDLAKKKIAEGRWETPNLLILKTSDGKRFDINYRRKHTLSLGDMYVGRNLIAFAIDKSYKDLMERSKVSSSLPFANDTMKTEMTKYLPDIYKILETDTKIVHIVRKSEDFVLARDLLTHYNGALPAAHVCWVLSSLYNVAAYLQYAKICHGDFSLDSILISPKLHSTMLTGGWWFSAKFSEKLIALPERTISVVSTKIISAKTPCSKIDLSLIKALGRELFGDVGGIKIDKDDTIPKPLSNWLKFPAGDNAFKEYSAWMQVLEKAYGKRRYTEMPIKFEDVYSN